MTPAATFCCLDCRLLQAPAEECRECGSPSVAALIHEGDVLKRAFARQRSKAGDAIVKGAVTVGAVSSYAAVVAGGALISPIIPALALGTFMGGALLWARQQNRRVTTVPLLAPKTTDNAVTRRGIARKLTETITTCDGADQALAEEAILRGKKADGVYFRRTRGTRFLVEVEAGERVVVGGILRVVTAKPSRSTAKAGTDPRLTALGIEGVQVAGTLELAVIRDGDLVEVTGEATTEAVPELAFDRDAGQATLMAGRAKTVVLVRHV